MGEIEGGGGGMEAGGVRGEWEGKGGERVPKDRFYFYFIYSATPGIPASEK